MLRHAGKRMNREEFFAKLGPLDEDQLRRALWNRYWRAPQCRALTDGFSPAPRRAQWREVPRSRPGNSLLGRGESTGQTLSHDPEALSRI